MSISSDAIFNVVGLGAGTFKDTEQNKSVDYANLIVLQDKENQINEHQNINIGQELAKVPLLTDNNNELAQKLASSGLVPGLITFQIKQLIKKGVMTLKVVGFTPKKAI